MATIKPATQYIIRLYPPGLFAVVDKHNGDKRIVSFTTYSSAVKYAAMMNRGA